MIIMNKSLILIPAIALIAAVGCTKQEPVASTPPANTTEPTLGQKTETALRNAGEKTKEVAVDTKNAISAKLVEWDLTPDDIKADLQKTGRVVRQKSSEMGTKAASTFDSAMITTAIKAKYVADSDLSALKIGVTTDKGVVTLDGSVASVELIAKAVAHALDTDGVTEVVSLLTVVPTT